MAAVTKKFIPGFTGSILVNAVSYPIVSGRTSNIDPGLWDATNEGSGGWMEQGTSTYKTEHKFTVLGTTDNPVPAIQSGEIYPVVEKEYGVTSYNGNVIMGAISKSIDLKGGISYDCTATSQGPMTGAMVPADVVPVPASGS